MSTISAGTTTPTALSLSGDTTGALTFQVNGTTTAATLSAAGNFSLATGNLTFSSTGQRITGDFSNATHSSRLLFQNSGANLPTVVGALPNGSSVTSAFVAYGGSTATDTATVSVVLNGGADARISSGILGTGTYLPMTFYTGGSERMRLDTSGNLLVGTTTARNILTVTGPNATAPTLGTASGTALFCPAGTTYGTMIGSSSGGQGWIQQQRVDTTATAYDLWIQPSGGNVGIGTTNTGTAGLSLLQSFNLSWEQSSTESLANIFRQTSSAATVIANGYKRSANANAFASSYGSSWAKTAISLGTATGAITFYTDTAATTVVGTDVTPTERMRIDSSGNVGIGTNIPDEALVISRTTDPKLRFVDVGNLDAKVGIVGSTALGFECNGSERMRITSGGEVYIAGTTDQGAYNLQCNGTGVWGAGAYVNGSDARLKNNIQSLDSGLDVVKAMRPVTFQYKPEYSKDQSVQPGFIAQELQTAMAGKPYLEGVVQEGTNHLNVAYQNIIPILVKAMQEQQDQIKALQDKIAALESK